jgi:hypothetical protein
MLSCGKLRHFDKYETTVAHCPPRRAAVGSRNRPYFIRNHYHYKI